MEDIEHPGDTPEGSGLDNVINNDQSHNCDNDSELCTRENLPQHGYSPGLLGGLKHQMVGVPVNFKPELFDDTGDWPDYVVYFEQLAVLHGWDKPTMAIVLGRSLKGSARTVPAGIALPREEGLWGTKKGPNSELQSPSKSALAQGRVEGMKACYNMEVLAGGIDAFAGEVWET